MSIHVKVCGESPTAVGALGPARTRLSVPTVNHVQNGGTVFVVLDLAEYSLVKIRVKSFLVTNGHIFRYQVKVTSAGVEAVAGGRTGMDTGTLFHQLALDTEEAIYLRVAERRHCNLIAARDDRDQIRIRVCDDVLEHLFLLLQGCQVAVEVNTIFRNIHTALVVERVLR